MKTLNSVTPIGLSDCTCASGCVFGGGCVLATCTSANELVIWNRFVQHKAFLLMVVVVVIVVTFIIVVGNFLTYIVSITTHRGQAWA
jgi:hypothetical protein